MSNQLTPEELSEQDPSLDFEELFDVKNVNDDDEEEEEPDDEKEDAEVEEDQEEDQEENKEEEDDKEEEEEKESKRESNNETALRKEIQRLRSDRRKLRLELDRNKAPSPKSEDEKEKVKLKNVPVKISPDGNDVFVDLQDLREALQEDFNRAVTTARQPTRDQIRATQETQLQNEFVSENPSLNTRIWSDMNNMHSFLQMSSQVKAAEEGYQPTSYEELMDFMDEHGILDQVGNLFPQYTSDEIDDFIHASVSSSPRRMKKVLRSISMRMAGDTDEEGDDQEESRPESKKRVVQKIKSRRSMARRGDRGRSSETKDDKEFAELSSQFDRDPMMMDAAKRARLKELGRRLRKPEWMDD